MPDKLLRRTFPFARPAADGKGERSEHSKDRQRRVHGRGRRRHGRVSRPGGLRGAGLGWHITPGNSTTVTLTTSDLVVVDNTTQATITCKRATLNAHLSGDGKIADSASLATISAGTFTSSAPCSLAGIPVLFRLKKPLALLGSQYANGVVTGRVGNGTTSAISASISGTGSISCRAQIRGPSLPAKYVNADHALNIDSGHAATLHITSVQGCLGLLNAGDSAYFAGDFSTGAPVSITYGA